MNKPNKKVVLKENVLPSALTTFPISGDWFVQQDNVPCLNQGVEGGPLDQNPVMASPFSRPEPH